MQVHYAIKEGVIRELHLPDAETEVIPGVLWGPLGGVPTASYWATLAFEHASDHTYRFEATGRDLLHELAFCLLGGYGIPAEVGWAAYKRVAELGLVRYGVKCEELREALLEPLSVGAKKVRYRFLNAKTEQLADALHALPMIDITSPDRNLRDDLLKLPGVGPKTASWIVRNMRASDNVAIIDIHLLRACRRLGIFRSDADPMRHYRELEERFLAFSQSLGVRSSFLDLLMWEYARAHPLLV